MSTIAIVDHSGYGHTAKIAVAAAAGATLLAIDAEGNLPDSAWATLAAAKTIVFGSPTCMGSVSWQFKKFADASSKPWFGQAWKDKLFAGFANSATMNGDKHSTLHCMMRLAMQHGGLWVGSGMMPNNSKAATRNDLNYVGWLGGQMTSTPSDASPAEMVPGDLATARPAAQAGVFTAGGGLRGLGACPGPGPCHCPPGSRAAAGLKFKGTPLKLTALAICHFRGRSP